MSLDKALKALKALWVRDFKVRITPSGPPSSPRISH